MKVWGNSKAVLICIATILLTFVIVSLFDIVIAVIYSRFYSDAAFIVTFGVGGIFAGVLGYMNGIAATTKTEAGRWILILLLIVAGVIFFFPLAAIEGGSVCIRRRAAACDGFRHCATPAAAWTRCAGRRYAARA